jgi:ubiquinone/menaquinone biosynthesis C-methylase UbiE
VSATTWADVWRRKGEEAQQTGQPGGPQLEDLIRVDGFDTATGAVSVSDWWARGRHIDETLRRVPQRPLRVLEVGCGAGAMLWTLRAPDMALVGVDPAASLLEIGRTAIPEAAFVVASAAALPFPASSFDAVFSHSVFAYFDALADVDTGLAEMDRVATDDALIFVLDVPDLATRAACEAHRDALTGVAPGAGRGGLHHLYVPRQRFVDAGARLGRAVTLSQTPLASHAMSAFRFHALLEPRR